MKSLFSKKSLIVILSALFAVCIIFAGITANKASANTDLERVTLSTTMDHGAQMRLTNPTGMRFIINVDEADFDLFGEDVKVVTMITQKNLLDAKGISVEDFDKDTDVKKAEVVFGASHFQAAKDAHGAIKLTATILEISDKNIAKDYVAKTYITDGEKIGYVEQATVASIFDVATEALKDETAEYDEYELGILAGYTKSCTVTLEGTDQTVKVPYGSKLSEEIGNPPACYVLSVKDVDGNPVALDAVVTSDLIMSVTYNHSYENGVCKYCHDVCAHVWENGACIVCGTVCEHDSYTDGVCDVCETACAHTAWTDGVCDTCAIVCTHEFVDGVCGTCGFVKVVRPYEAVYGPLTSNDMYITNNDNGTVTVGADTFTSRSQFVQVFNGEFKANTTYIITLSTAFFAIDPSMSWVLQLYVDFDSYALAESTPVMLEGAGTAILEYTVGDTDIEQITLCSTSRTFNDQVLDMEWSMTITAKIEEKGEEIIRPYDVKDLNAAYTATYNEDGSITISGNELNWIEYKQVLNGEFKANTTYKVTVTALDIAVTDTPGWIRIMPDFNGIVVNKENPSNYLCTWITTYEMEYTVGDTDIDSIIIYTLYRYGNSYASSTPFAITLKATAEEVLPYAISGAPDNYTVERLEDGRYKFSGESFEMKDFLQVFNGEFKANTTYLITLSWSEVTGANKGNFQINNSLDGYTSDANRLGRGGADLVQISVTIGATDVDSIKVYTRTRDGSAAPSAGAFSFILSGTIVEVKDYDLTGLDAYALSYGDNGITISGDLYPTRVDFYQVFRGDFKAGKTYTVTMTATFAGDRYDNMQIRQCFGGNSFGPYVMAAAPTTSFDVTVDADTNVLSVLTVMRDSKGSGTAFGSFIITLNATIAEKVA